MCLCDSDSLASPAREQNCLIINKLQNRQYLTKSSSGQIRSCSCADVLFFNK